MKNLCPRCKGGGLDDTSGFGDFDVCDECKGAGVMNEHVATFKTWIDELKYLPGVTVCPESPPLKPDGVYFADLVFNGTTQVVVQWSPSKGYGVSKVTDDMGLSSHPDNAFPQQKQATDCVKTILYGSV